MEQAYGRTSRTTEGPAQVLDTVTTGLYGEGGEFRGGSPLVGEEDLPDQREG